MTHLLWFICLELLGLALCFNTAKEGGMTVLFDLAKNRKRDQWGDVTISAIGAAVSLFFACKNGMTLDKVQFVIVGTLFAVIAVYIITRRYFSKE